jgi:hypothetical protein
MCKNLEKKSENDRFATPSPCDHMLANLIY